MEKEVFAIAFAKWLNQNRWFEFDENSNKWYYTFEMGTSLSRGTYEKHYMKTSEELIEKFKSSNEFKKLFDEQSR